MTEGDVVPTPLPQADGQVKNRPAVVLRAMPPHGDLLVCGVSTQLHHATPGFDEVIRPGDSDFASSSLRAASSHPRRLSGSASGKQFSRIDWVNLS